MEGYGLDNLLLNAAIATKYRGKFKLAGVWEFVEHLTKTMSPSVSSSGGYNLTHQGIYPIWTSLGTLDAASASGGPISAALNADEDGPGGEGGGLVSELEERLRRMNIKGSGGSTGRGSRSASVSRKGSGTHTPRERKISERTSHTHTNTHSHSHAHTSSTYPQGPPSYLPAISHLLSSRLSFPDKAIHPSELRPSISSSSEKVELRRLILTICGESKEGGKGEVEEMLRRGERSKAAFRAFFRGDESGTVGILMSSEDPNDTLLGSTIAGFMSQSASTRGSEYFNAHWPNLIRRVDDPYVRAILSRIAGEDWESVLEEEYIPLLERMVVGVQYLDDWEFSTFLKGRMSRFARSSSLHMLPLTGLSPPALSLLSRYLARTGDLQTVTLLAAFFPPGKLNQAEKMMVERWREGYRDMLDSWGMWGERCEFDVKWGNLQRSLGGEDAGEEGYGKTGTCPVCNNPLPIDTEHRLHQKHAMRGTPSVGWPSERTTVCVYCQAPLPRCVICLLHVDPHRPPVDDGERPGHVTDTIDSAYVFCLTCRHGGHANHILPWFEGGLDGGIAHSVCAVADCDCECANI